MTIISIKWSCKVPPIALLFLTCDHLITRCVCVLPARVRDSLAGDGQMKQKDHIDCYCIDILIEIFIQQIVTMHWNGLAMCVDRCTYVFIAISRYWFNPSTSGIIAESIFMIFSCIGLKIQLKCYESLAFFLISLRNNEKKMSFEILGIYSQITWNWFNPSTCGIIV